MNEPCVLFVVVAPIKVRLGVTVLADVVVTATAVSNIVVATISVAAAIVATVVVGIIIVTTLVATIDDGPIIIISPLAPRLTLESRSLVGTLHLLEILHRIQTVSDAQAAYSFIMFIRRWERLVFPQAIFGFNFGGI
jgi:hypothetical protein